MNNAKLFSLAAAGLLASVATASAADLAARPAYTKAPVAPVAAVYNWGGFYVGANLGGASDRSHTDSPLANSGAGNQYITSVVTDINAQRYQTVTASGFIGGVQAGYNWQAGNFVFGLEGDINSFRLHGTTVTSAYFTGFPGPGTAPTYTNAVSTTWLATIRGRAGFAVDRAFFYGTGGAAITDLSYQHSFVEGTFAGSSSGVENSSASATKVGWTAGAGLEYALPGSGNWTLKAEYLYLNFGSVSSTAPVTGVAGSVFSHTADLTAQIGRVGINYKFGGPVVAKY